MKHFMHRLPDPSKPHIEIVDRTTNDDWVHGKLIVMKTSLVNAQWNFMGNDKVLAHKDLAEDLVKADVARYFTKEEIDAHEAAGLKTKAYAKKKAAPKSKGD